MPTWLRRVASNPASALAAHTARRSCAAGGARGAGATTASPTADVLTEAVARAEFRRYCSGRSVPLASGVRTAQFVAYLARVRAVDEAAAERALRGWPASFAFDAAGGVSMPQGEAGFGGLGTGRFERDMAALAALLPVAGVPSAEFKTLLEERVPAFSAGAVGALTLREAVALFPDHFSVTRAAAGWTVKPVLTPLQQQQRAARAAAQPTPAPAAPPPAPPADVAAPSFEDEFPLAVAQLRHSTGGGPGSWQDADAALALLERTLAERQRRSERQRQPQRAPLSPSEAVQSASAADAAEAAPPAAPFTPQHFGGSDWLALLESCRGLETRPALVVRERRPPRGAHLFVDGDGLSKDDVTAVCRRLGIQLAVSTVVVARQANQPPHTPQDFVAPHAVRTYMAVELAAERMRLASTVVLKDVVYVCCESRRALYADHVARAVAFPDAPVIVATPLSDVVVARPPPVD